MTQIYETKKAIFYKYKIYIKKENKYIEKDDIVCIYYAKWSIKNYISHLNDGIISPGFLYIFLKDHTVFKYGYCFRMKLEEVQKIPKSLCKNFTIVE